MAHYEGSYLIMSKDEINALIERCHRPEVIQKRNAFFAELDKMGITRNPDGSMEVEFTPKQPDSANTLLREATDVVEVVRCRDCVFGNMPCEMARYPDFFCADGKRKDGGQDK